MKGLSPLVAVVLLVAFTIAVAGVISVWITGLSRSQTEVVGEEARLQVKCAASSLAVKEVRRVGGLANITYALETGTEELFNISVEINALGNTTKAGPFFVNTSMKPGESSSTSFNFTPVGPIELVRVRGLCQNKTPIIGECKIREPCMVSN